MRRLVGDDILAALAPITPGKLDGLEIIAGSLMAEDDLRTIGNNSTAFSGGEAGRQHVEGLVERLRRYEQIRQPDGALLERVKRQKLAEIRAFAAFVNRGQVEPADTERTADAPLVTEAPT